MNKMTYARMITCSVCKSGGGTLIKDGKDGYKHQDPKLCESIRRRNILFSKKIKLPITPIMVDKHVRL